MTWSPFDRPLPKGAGPRQNRLVPNPTFQVRRQRIRRRVALPRILLVTLQANRLEIVIDDGRAVVSGY